MKATNNLTFNLIISAVIGFALIFTACSPQMPTQSNSSANTINTQTVNINSNVNNTAPTVKKNSVNLPVTLPVLDAMFYDESFTAELKSNVGLSDEEIEKLKTASGEAVANLGEDDENTRSTRAATKRAEDQIRGILGEEKANKLFELVSNRWAAGATGAETASASAPNSIPTDTRIVVNAPAYRMDVFQVGKLT